MSSDANIYKDRNHSTGKEFLETVNVWMFNVPEYWGVLLTWHSMLKTDDRTPANAWPNITDCIWTAVNCQLLKKNEQKKTFLYTKTKVTWAVSQQTILITFNLQSPNPPKLTYISGKVAASPNIPPPIRPIDPKLAREARTIDVQKKWYWSENAAH